MPQFLTPWMLWGLALVSVPVIIHMLQRRRVIQVPFSTLRFLKMVSARTSRRSRVENLLLLILRCLIFGLLLLAAARPVISPQASSLLRGAVPRTVVLVVDNSMSMSYRLGETSRLETAKKQALAILGDLKDADDVAVLASNDQMQPLVPEPTVKHDVARQAIQGIAPTQLRTDFAAALREARKIVTRSSKKIRRVYLLTDNQEQGWRFDKTQVFDESWKQSGAKLIVVRPDDVKSVNGAITKAVFHTPVTRAGAGVRGVVTVENFSAAPLQDLIEVKLGKERVWQRAVEVAANSALDVPFDFVVTAVEGNTVRGTFQLQGDHLIDDDRYFFWLPVTQAARTLVVEGQQVGPMVLHSGFFLQRALGIGVPAMPKAVGAADLDNVSLDGITAIFLCDLPRYTDLAMTKLERFLQTGGTAIFLLGDQVDIESLNRVAFLPVKVGGVRELPTGRLVVRVAEPDHPLVANTWDSNTPFPALPQQKAATMKLRKDAKAVLTLPDDTPFVVVGDHGAGKVVVINASADRAWGDFPLSPGAFLPLVQQLSRWSSEQFTKSGGFTVGQPLPVPLALARDAGLMVTTPAGVVQALPAGDEAVVVTRAEQAGFYELSSAKDGVVQVYAVNVPVGESNLKEMEEPALKDLVAHETARGMDGLKLWMEKDRELTPLWPWLLLAALVAFGAETMIANVMARNRSQADERHIRTGRLNKRRLGQIFRPAEAEEPVEAKR